jgi:hypothetical protein
VLSFVGGGASNDASGNGSVIVSGYDNTASGYESFVGSGEQNIASGTQSTIGGGYAGRASGNYSVVGGGQYNKARGNYSVVGGGGGASEADSNSASGSYAAIAGGTHNRASGNGSFVAGGSTNEAGGLYSFASGCNAHANHFGSFVRTDGSGTSLSSSLSNEFTVRAQGGYRLYTNDAHTSGVTLAGGGNAWASVCDSARKRLIRPLDSQDILNRFSSLPLKRWEYKSENAGIEHIGPMAQDFWNSFHLGSDSLGITTIDADGVMMAAIQELQKQNAELQAKNDALEQRTARLEIQLQQLCGQGGSSIRQVSLTQTTR